MCFLSGKELSLHQVQKRSWEGPKLPVSGSGPTSITPSPSYHLPSEGLPLCCPPAKVHTSPATTQWGLSPSPTSRSWTHSTQTGRIVRVFGSGLLSGASRRTKGSQAGALTKEGAGAQLAVYLGTSWAAELEPSPRAGAKTSLIGIRAAKCSGSGGSSAVGLKLTVKVDSIDSGVRPPEFKSKCHYSPTACP